MEICAPSQRNSVGALFMLPWSFGYMLMPGLAYLVRPWRWLQAVYASLFLITIVYFWYGYDMGFVMGFPIVCSSQ